MPHSCSPPEQLVAIGPAFRRVWGILTWPPVCTAFLYATTVLLAALTLSPYFAQTWDVATFIQAAHRFMDGGNPSDLYAVSRAAQTWPFAYPPLHAVAVALALALGNLLHILPEYVWARVPGVLADVGVGIVLYRVVAARSGDCALARAAVLLWLFNPVTFYNTAVQGHFESEWLLFVLLAYVGLEHARGVLWPTAALTVAVLFKQIAILFAVPFWGRLLTEAFHDASGTRDASKPRRWIPFLDSFLLFAFLGGAVCLPFLLYSSDFLYMTFAYVADVPVQTQSWIVGLLGATRATRDALNSDFILLRYQTIATIGASIVISIIAQRKGWSLYLTGALIVLMFFLTSKKVMGYYYVMLYPFLLVECVLRRRFDLLLMALLATTWISLSPYFASWGNPDHWWVYAFLGSLNSLFFLWLGLLLVARKPDFSEKSGFRQWNNPRVALFVSLGLFGLAALASFLQPLMPNSGSPIRAPIVAAGFESNALVGLVALVALGVIFLIGLAFLIRPMTPGVIPRAAWAIVLVFVPLFFTVYSLTKESTLIFELVLKTLGV